MGRASQHLGFLVQYLTRPTAVGAIAPSSRHLAREMVSDMPLASARCIAEFGAGTGAFTGHIVESAASGADLLVFEMNPAMARMLCRNFPSTEVIVDSAARIRDYLTARGHTQVDCVICGLPWASFSDATQNSILHPLAECLSPGGCFATFAYIHAAWFPTARRFRRKLEGLFSEVRQSRVVWRNLPPAFVLRCQKAPAGAD